MATSLNYGLTIQLALDGLSFALFDITNSRLVCWEHSPSGFIADSSDLFSALEKALSTKTLNDIEPHSVTIVIDERFNILVPEALYCSDDNNRLLDFGFNIPKNTVTQTDTLKRHGAVNVFALPQTLQVNIKAKWPEARIIHSSSVFLESLPESNEATVHVNVRNRDFDMAIMKDQLLFFNNFQFNDKNDFTYFLLNALEQNNLSGHETRVCFSGQVQPSSEIIELCRHYIKDIQFVEKPEALQVDDAFANVPYPYYHILYQAIR